MNTEETIIVNPPGYWIELFAKILIGITQFTALLYILKYYKTEVPKAGYMALEFAIWIAVSISISGFITGFILILLVWCAQELYLIRLILNEKKSR